MLDLVAHFVIFTIIAVVFLLLPLAIGWFVRPNLPTEQKESVYECGEPTIGSSYIQFDLRFYVVALLFIIFDVEVAFFFPWGMVYGGAAQLADPRLSAQARSDITQQLLSTQGADTAASITPETAQSLLMVGLVDILVFFGVLLVGFAYVWKRGDLQWVRAVSEKAKQAAARPSPLQPGRRRGPAQTTGRLRTARRRQPGDPPYRRAFPSASSTARS